MSGTQKPELPAEAGDDPSMEDILASIRRILSEEGAPASGLSHAEEPVASDDVLVLDSSMMIVESQQPEATPEQEPEPAAPTTTALVAPAAAAAAASAMGNLVRTLAADRAAQVRSGGPTIEDLVRAELRPLLKEWLDTNLPSLVERLVRTEIERVVGRAVP
jgi:hypothetical protein